MFPMCDINYQSLKTKIVTLASIVFDCFASFLLQLCFLHNKTTFLFGINDCRTKTKMGCCFEENKWFIPVLCKAYGTVQCGVVGNYKYLGLVGQQKGFNLDTAAKVKNTKSAVGELYGCLFKFKFSMNFSCSFYSFCSSSFATSNDATDYACPSAYCCGS